MSEIPLEQRRIDLALMPDDQLELWESIQRSSHHRALHDGDQPAAERFGAELDAVHAEQSLRAIDALWPF